MTKKIVLKNETMKRILMYKHNELEKANLNEDNLLIGVQETQSGT